MNLAKSFVIVVSVFSSFICLTVVCDTKCENVDLLDDDRVKIKIVETENARKFVEIRRKAKNIQISDHQSIFVEFSSIRIINGLEFSGTVGAFNVSYTVDDDNKLFLPIFDEFGSPKVFRSVFDTNLKTQLDFPIFAKYVRISPRIPQNFITSELELKIFGCSYEESFFNFDGSSCVDYDLRRNGFVVSAKNHLSFFIKTTESDGIILSSIGNQLDFILVSMRNGRLEIFFDFGSRTPSSLIAHFPINDDIWHRVDLIHDERLVTIYVDAVKFNSTSPYGANFRLDLDRNVFVGCAPLIRQFLPFLHGGMRNFSGCLTNVTLNGRPLIGENFGRQKFETFRNIGLCQKNKHEGSSITLNNPYTAIELTTKMFGESATTKFSFRTFAKNVTLMNWTFSKANASTIFVFLHDGELVARFSRENMPTFDIKSKTKVDDSLWHTIEITASLNLLHLKVDERPMQIVRGKFNFKSIKNIFRFGDGFLGCLRDFYVDNVLQSFSEFRTITGLMIDGCNLRDLCLPNPCTNGGVCTAYWNNFECSCLDGFSGKTCQINNFPKTCEEYFETNTAPGFSKAISVFLDLDGAGPLPPMKVTCLMDNGRMPMTVIHHDQAAPVEIAGFAGRGEGQIVFNYDDVSRANLAKFVQVHEKCRQEMKFECFGGTRLLNSPYIQAGPATWWMGFSGVHINSWGEAEPNSRMCTCGLSGVCLNGMPCNCDTGLDAVDAGNMTFKEHLPVRRIFVGDTNFHGKFARITVGDLICWNSTYRKPVTFTKSNAYLNLESKKWRGSSVEIRLEFLTTYSAFTLLSNHPRHSLDFFNLYVKNGVEVFLEVVSSGHVYKIQRNSSKPLNDEHWHTISVILTNFEFVLSIDHEVPTSSKSEQMIPPDLDSTFRLGASIEHGSIFSGAFRNVFINGEFFDLMSLSEKSRFAGGIENGLGRKCAKENSCKNGGKCLEFFSHFECDCTSTAFEGELCENDVGYEFDGRQSETFFVDQFKSNVLLRVGFSTKNRDSNESVFFIRSFKDALLKQAVFVLEIVQPKGFLRLNFSDGKANYSFNDSRFTFDDGAFYDLTIRIKKNAFVWQLGRYKSLTFDVSDISPVARPTYWIIGDIKFNGCLSKMQIGANTFPLKFADLVEGSKRSLCNLNSPLSTSSDTPKSDVYSGPSGSYLLLPRLIVEPVRVDDNSFLVGVCTAIAVCCAVLVLCCCYRCWRTRPSGEYKTHEDTLMYMTSDSSQQALVPRSGGHRREWFI